MVVFQRDSGRIHCFRSVNIIEITPVAYVRTNEEVSCCVCRRVTFQIYLQISSTLIFRRL